VNLRVGRIWSRHAGVVADDNGLDEARQERRHPGPSPVTGRRRGRMSRQRHRRSMRLADTTTAPSSTAGATRERQCGRGERREVRVIRRCQLRTCQVEIEHRNGRTTLQGKSRTEKIPTCGGCNQLPPAPSRQLRDGGFCRGQSFGLLAMRLVAGSIGNVCGPCNLFLPLADLLLDFFW